MHTHDIVSDMTNTNAMSTQPQPGDTVRTYVLTDDGMPTDATVLEVFEAERVALVSIESGADPYEVSLDYLDVIR